VPVGEVVKSIRPSWRSTTMSTVDKPRPVPWPSGFVVTKGSNTLCRMLSGIPDPLSDTVISTSLPARAVPTVRQPPESSIAWTAFTARLMRAISSWFETPSTGGRPAASLRSMRTPFFRAW